MKPKLLTLFLMTIVSFAIHAQGRLSIVVNNSGSLQTCSQADDGICDLACASSTIPVDYGTVEVLLEKEITFTISNAGTPFQGNLTINSVQLGATNNHWEITGAVVSPTPLASGSSLPIVAVKFKPQNEPGLSLSAPLENTLIVQTGASAGCFASPTTITYRLVGQPMKTTINYSLVIDRSGSMSTIEGSGATAASRIKLLSDALDYFLTLERLRVQDAEFDGDSLGIVKYDHEVDAAYQVPQAVTDAFITSVAKPKINEAATNDNALIRPRGSTATGNAVKASVENHFPHVVTGSRRNIMILFSDGYENTGLRSNSPEINTLLTSRPDIDIYSVGMGDAWDASLKQYTFLSGLSPGQYFPVTDPAFDLSSFFGKIYDHAIGYQTLLDPMYNVDFTDSSTHVVSSVWLTSSDRKVVFSIFVQSALKEFGKFEIVSPKGEVLANGPMAGGLTTKFLEGANHIVYELDLSKATDASLFVGRWDFRIKPHVDRAASAPRSASVGFSASTLSNLRLDLNTAAPGEEPGNEIIVDVAVSENGNEVTSQNSVQTLIATVSVPSGKQYSLKPEYIGRGRFRTRFDDTFNPGRYKVLVRSTLKNRKGEIATREATSFVLIGKKLPPPLCPEPKTNLWLWIAVILAFIALAVAILRPMRKPIPK